LRHGFVGVCPRSRCDNSYLAAIFEADTFHQNRRRRPNVRDEPRRCLAPKAAPQPTCQASALALAPCSAGRFVERGRLRTGQKLNLDESRPRRNLRLLLRDRKKYTPARPRTRFRMRGVRHRAYGPKTHGPYRPRLRRPRVYRASGERRLD
jgi:hypothetical protein